MAKPFVKWAGGKSQLLEEIRRHYPSGIDRYCEPFVGGGAVLFDVLQKFHLKEVLINDINGELINTYFQIKNNCESLIQQLSVLQERYGNSSLEENKLLFYEKRKRYNEIKVSGNELESLEKAALFIFLNKTCFNGLYRVNAKGLFNVPFNSARNPLICDRENLLSCSQVLQNVEMTVGDYSRCGDFINGRTFVYIDPPYRPLSQTAAFTSYSENGFSDKEQIELVHFVERIARKGAMFVASNSDPKNSNAEDDFFDELYKDFDIKRVSAVRAINSKGDRRGKMSELLISNVKELPEFALTAEELFKTEEYMKIFTDAFGDFERDEYAKSKYENDIAKTRYYTHGFFYYPTGRTREIGLGYGLYLGKDVRALHNFYNCEGEFGDISVIEYWGTPNFIDLTSLSDYEKFEREAIETFGLDAQKSYLKKLTLKKGYDGIRYFDPTATGEEFVLFNTKKVKKTATKVFAR